MMPFPKRVPTGMPGGKALKSITLQRLQDADAYLIDDAPSSNPEAWLARNGLHKALQGCTVLYYPFSGAWGRQQRFLNALSAVAGEVRIIQQLPKSGGGAVALCAVTFQEWLEHSVEWGN